MEQKSIMPDRAAALIRKGDLILMIFRIREGKEYLILPGGKIEPGETPESAVMREIAEETSIETEFKQKITEFQTADGRRHYIFLCSYVSGEPKLADGSPEKLENTGMNFFEPRWVTKDEMLQAYVWPQETKPFLISYLK